MIPKIQTLPNGLRVMMVHIPDYATVSMLVLVDAGAADETAPAFGVAHFLEHMCFKGTEARPVPGQIARELEGLGAATNAFTGRYMTGYWAKVQPKQAPEVLEVVADLYLNPVFAESEIEKERGVVLEELKMYEDHPRALAPDVLNLAMYGDSAQGRPIVGYENTVSLLNKNDLETFRKAHYHPERTVVVIAGSFDPPTMRTLVKKLFGKAQGGTIVRHKRIKPTLSSERMRVRVRPSEQSHMILGVPALPLGHKDEHGLLILANILGGGMSSRLFHRIREEMGAAYYISASDAAYPGYGQLTFHAGVQHIRVEEVASAILEECHRLMDEAVDNDELERVKRYVVGQLMLGLDSSDAVGEYYGVSLLEGVPILVPTVRARAIRAVTSGDIKRLARQLFKPNAFHFALVGPRAAKDLSIALP